MANIPKPMIKISGLKKILFGSSNGDVLYSYEVTNHEELTSILSVSIEYLNQFSSFFNLGSLKEVQLYSPDSTNFLIVNQDLSFSWANVVQKKLSITGFQSTSDLLKTIKLSDLDLNEKATPTLDLPVKFSIEDDLNKDETLWDDLIIDEPSIDINKPIIIDDSLTNSSFNLGDFKPTDEKKTEIQPIRFISGKYTSEVKEDSRFTGNVFTGEIHLFSVADLLEFFRSGHKSGKLFFKNNDDVIALYLKDGRISAVEAPEIISISTVLVKLGFLSNSDARKYQVDAKMPDFEFDFTKNVLEAGVVDLEQLKQAIKLQIKTTIKHLISWKDGRFAFHNDENLRTHIVNFSLDSQMLLLDAFREIDEGSRNDL